MAKTTIHQILEELAASINIRGADSKRQGSVARTVWHQKTRNAANVRVRKGME